MTARLFVLAAAATIASAAPRIAVSQAIPDKPTPPAPATPAVTDSTKDIDPVGTYTVYLTAQGNAMTTTTVIEKKPDGSYSGTVTGDGIPPLPVNSVTVAGNHVKLSVTAPDGSEALIEMIVKGEDITGKWSMANDGSSITGKRVPNP